ncbi:MAG: ribonuclease catalytic domain-containing protein [Candidatus Riflebacteria bacterium]|nr:ribonuclease catalytic domain-containing protein [Candidatus Riflebacteria bacterium]
MNISSGCIVEYNAKGSMPEIGAVLSSAAGTIRLLLLNGKETNIPEKKVLYSTKRGVIPTSDRERCKQLLIEANNKRNEVAAQINLEELHELLAGEPKGYTFEEIAEFIFSKDDEDSVAAMLRKLSEDRIYFKSKNDLFTPVSEDDLKQAIEQQNKKEQAEKEEAELIDGLKKLSEGKIAEALNGHINSLKEYAACGEEANLPKRLQNAIEKSGISVPVKMFRALVSAGLLNEDENLEVIRYRLPTEFSKEQITEAQKICETGLNTSERKDLTGLKVWAIDTPESKDRDDAFSFEQDDNGNFTLWVHISDPAEVIKPDDLLDKEAKCRGTSVYMPDARIHMLPDNLSENFLSLDEKNVRGALSFKMTFDSLCNLIDFEIIESVIQIEKATDYDSANSILNDDEWLKSAYDFSQKLKQKRVENGAVIIPRQPEPEVKVRDGVITVELRDRDCLCAGMISEFMIWTNHVAAEWFKKNDIPCLYRSQDGDENTKKEFKEEFDALAFWQALRTFRKTVVGTAANKHFSLGVNSYTQITSPLRRYSDLVLHRQIKSFIREKKNFYTEDELTQEVLISDISVGRAEDIMQKRERYFMLKYLKNERQTMSKQKKDLLLNGVVVDTSSNNEVTFYVDFLCGFRHCRKPDFDVSPGQKVSVKVNQIDLYDGIIRFDLLPLVN